MELFTITTRARVRPTLDRGVVLGQRRGHRLLLGKPLAADVMSLNALSKGTSKCHSSMRPATPIECALNKVTIGHRESLDGACTLSSSYPYFDCEFYPSVLRRVS
jgi:hypothetical protein